MRRKPWIPAALLCAALLLATAQTARADETVPVPSDLPTVATAETTTTTTTTEPETDENGVTLYPPPTTTTTTTASTKRTARTEPPFVINPDHPEDTYSGPTPYAPIPTWVVRVTDQYGNEITSYVTAPPTTTAPDTTTQDTTAEEDTTPALEYEDGPKQPIPWGVAAAAGAALLAAAGGVVFMLVRNRKNGGDDDDYIYEDSAE